MKRRVPSRPRLLAVYLLMWISAKTAAASARLLGVKA